MARLDWIDAFMSATENLASPPLFRKWGAIMAVAGAMERKTWVRTLGSNLFPNLFVVFVAPAGIGKSEVTFRIRDMWEGLGDHHIASMSVTRASLADELNLAERKIITNEAKNPVYSFNSLLIAIDELGVLVPAYDNEFMNVLTHLYDGKNYTERKRSNKIEIQIERTNINLLAGCTPNYLTTTLPEGAWEQGFISRTLLIFANEQKKVSLFEDKTVDDGEFKALSEGLKVIAELYGKFTWSAAAAERVDKFWMTGGDPAPSHPKLISYNARRTSHLIKLSMIASASRSSEMVIEAEDFMRALDWLIEAEVYMPEIFKAMAITTTGKIMEEAWYYLYTTFIRENKPVARSRLIQFLQERVPVNNIAVTIQMMIEGKMIEEIPTSAGPTFRPVAKRPNL